MRKWETTEALLRMYEAVLSIVLGEDLQLSHTPRYCHCQRQNHSQITDNQEADTGLDTRALKLA